MRLYSRTIYYAHASIQIIMLLQVIGIIKVNANKTISDTTKQHSAPLEKINKHSTVPASFVLKNFIDNDGNLHEYYVKGYVFNDNNITKAMLFLPHQTETDQTTITMDHQLSTPVTERTKFHRHKRSVETPIKNKLNFEFNYMADKVSQKGNNDHYILVKKSAQKKQKKTTTTYNPVQWEQSLLDVIQPAKRNKSSDDKDGKDQKDLDKSGLNKKVFRDVDNFLEKYKQQERQVLKQNIFKRSSGEFVSGDTNFQELPNKFDNKKSNKRKMNPSSPDEPYDEVSTGVDKKTLEIVNQAVRENVFFGEEKIKASVTEAISSLIANGGKTFDQTTLKIKDKRSERGPSNIDNNRNGGDSEEVSVDDPGEAAFKISRGKYNLEKGSQPDGRSIQHYMIANNHLLGAIVTNLQNGSNETGYGCAHQDDIIKPTMVSTGKIEYEQDETYDANAEDYDKPEGSEYASEISDDDNSSERLANDKNSAKNVYGMVKNSNYSADISRRKRFSNDNKQFFQRSMEFPSLAASYFEIPQKRADYNGEPSETDETFEISSDTKKIDENNNNNKNNNDDEISVKISSKSDSSDEQLDNRNMNENNDDNGEYTSPNSLNNNPVGFKVRLENPMEYTDSSVENIDFASTQRPVLVMLVADNNETQTSGPPPENAGTHFSVLGNSIFGVVKNAKNASRNGNFSDCNTDMPSHGNNNGGGGGAGGCGSGCGCKTPFSENAKEERSSMECNSNPSIIFKPNQDIFFGALKRIDVGTIAQKDNKASRQSIRSDKLSPRAMNEIRSVNPIIINSQLNNPAIQNEIRPNSYENNFVRLTNKVAEPISIAETKLLTAIDDNRRSTSGEILPQRIVNKKNAVMQSRKNSGISKLRDENDELRTSKIDKYKLELNAAYMNKILNIVDQLSNVKRGIDNSNLNKRYNVDDPPIYKNRVKDRFIPVNELKVEAIGKFLQWMQGVNFKDKRYADKYKRDQLDKIDNMLKKISGVFEKAKAEIQERADNRNNRDISVESRDPRSVNDFDVYQPNDVQFLPTLDISVPEKKESVKSEGRTNSRQLQEYEENQMLQNNDESQFYSYDDLVAALGKVLEWNLVNEFREKRYNTNDNSNNDLAEYYDDLNINQRQVHSDEPNGFAYKRSVDAIVQREKNHYMDKASALGSILHYKLSKQTRSRRKSNKHASDRYQSFLADTYRNKVKSLGKIYWHKDKSGSVKHVPGKRRFSTDMARIEAVGRMFHKLSQQIQKRQASRLKSSKLKDNYSNQKDSQLENLEDNKKHVKRRNIKNEQLAIKTNLDLVKRSSNKQSIKKIMEHQAKRSSNNKQTKNVKQRQEINGLSETKNELNLVNKKGKELHKRKSNNNLRAQSEQHINKVTNQNDSEEFSKYSNRNTVNDDVEEDESKNPISSDTQDLHDSETNLEISDKESNNLLEDKSEITSKESDKRESNEEQKEVNEDENNNESNSEDSNEGENISSNDEKNVLEDSKDETSQTDSFTSEKGTKKIKKSSNTNNKPHSTKDTDKYVKRNEHQKKLNKEKNKLTNEHEDSEQLNDNNAETEEQQDKFPTKNESILQKFRDSNRSKKQTNKKSSNVQKQKLTEEKETIKEKSDHKLHNLEENQTGSISKRFDKNKSKKEHLHQQNENEDESFVINDNIQSTETKNNFQKDLNQIKKRSDEAIKEKNIKRSDNSESGTLKSVSENLIEQQKDEKRSNTVSINEESSTEQQKDEKRCNKVSLSEDSSASEQLKDEKRSNTANLNEENSTVQQKDEKRSNTPSFSKESLIEQQKDEKRSNTAGEESSTEQQKDEKRSNTVSEENSTEQQKDMKRSDNNHEQKKEAESFNLDNISSLINNEHKNNELNLQKLEEKRSDCTKCNATSNLNKDHLIGHFNEEKRSNNNQEDYKSTESYNTDDHEENKRSNNDTSSGHFSENSTKTLVKCVDSKCHENTSTIQKQQIIKEHETNKQKEIGEFYKRSTNDSIKSGSYKNDTKRATSIENLLLLQNDKTAFRNNLADSDKNLCSNKLDIPLKSHSDEKFNKQHEKMNEIKRRKRRLDMKTESENEKESIRQRKQRLKGQESVAARGKILGWKKTQYGRVRNRRFSQRKKKKQRKFKKDNKGIWNYITSNNNIKSASKSRLNDGNYVFMLV